MSIGEDITDAVIAMTGVAVDQLGREYFVNETAVPLRLIAFDEVRDEVHDFTVDPGCVVRIPRWFRVLVNPTSKKCARCIFMDGIGKQ